MAYIYTIRFKDADGIYVGSTIQDPKQRLREHISRLRNNKHHSKALQNKYNKYGIDLLLFDVIDMCMDSDRYSIEQWYIDVLSYGYKLLNGSSMVQPLGKTQKTKELNDRTRETLLNNPIFWEKMNLINAKYWGDLISPDGKVYTNIHNLRQFSLTHNLPYTKMKDMARGKTKSCDGWKRYIGE